MINERVIGLLFQKNLYSELVKEVISFPQKFHFLVLIWLPDNFQFPKGFSHEIFNSTVAFDDKSQSWKLAASVADHRTL